MPDFCDNGYLMLPRDLTVQEIFRLSGDAALVYLYFYARAHWKRNNGRPVGTLETSYPLAKGELVKTVGFRPVPLTKKAWKASTELLTKRGLIRTVKTAHGMIVTVCEYDRYTDPKSYETASETDSETDMKPTSEADTFPYREEEKKEDSQSGGGEAPGAAPEKKENIGSNRAWEKWYRDFRACPGCVDVNRMAFENTIKGALYADPGLDVGEVIAEFGRKWSGGRPAKPIAALEAELARHLPENETGEPPAPPAWTPSFGFKSKKGEGLAPLGGPRAAAPGKGGEGI